MKHHDELLERYAQAKAQLPDGLPTSPPAALHDRIMRAAREQAVTMNSVALSAYSMPGNGPKQHQNTIPTTEAANDSFWSIKAVASIAVMGLSALIWWQFEQGTPQEQEAAKSAQPSPAVVATAPVTAPAPGVASESIASSANATAQVIPAPAADRQQAAKKAVPAITAAPEPERPRPPELASTKPATPSIHAARAEAIEPQTASAETSMSDSSARSSAQGMSAPTRARKEAQAETQSAPIAAAAPMPAPAARAAASLQATTPNPIALALLAALQTHDAAALRQALAQGASPNTRTPDGSPALTQAVIQRWHEGVRILLAAGANKEAKNNKGHTAADVAFEMGYSDMTELLATPR